MAPSLFKSKKRTRDSEKKENVSDASSSSSSESSSDSGSDSEDEEVENAMFRPAPKEVETESEPELNEEEEEEEEETPTKEEVVEPVKQKKKKNEKKVEQPEEEDQELKEEIDRKTEATVYVEGIAYKASESDLVTHFSSCGTVREVRMPRYQDSGKPRGYAHVVFDDEAALKKALKLDGEYLFNRYLSIRRAEAPRAVEMALKEKNQNATKKAVKGCRTVYIKQLPYEVEEDAIREALASCGTITSVRLPIWNHTKKLKGFGYVEFSSEDEALAAARRSGMKIGNRMVLISLDAPGSAPKASFRQVDGQYWSKGEEAKKSLAKKINEKQQRQSANKKRKTK
ncbi:Squamous cell carcinoma antigen recognized by T-cells 3 [Phytophthora citrophthora]|uniref:Squamous cell carcinoma antigen recognized by T-cells 3 n=1 Tax=Phytophthora citrophthora TaxID=4793 RepID=A0AAD9GWJ5_9STRA|nr:Squamous cell carcinoma antigen recognized by T-cells 3 [Phytophthora citrophthora]